jgi:LacI family gluconate utilization system Gnt-I transcriptional repressor
MLVGFSHEKVGEATADYLLRKGYKRPGLLWTVDNRAALRKSGLCEALARHDIHDPAVVDVRFRRVLPQDGRGFVTC